MSFDPKPNESAIEAKTTPRIILILLVISVVSIPAWFNPIKEKNKIIPKTNTLDITIDPLLLPNKFNMLLIHRSEEHTSELQSRENLVCRLLLEKKKIKTHLQT